MTNILLETWNTEFNLPPFAEIEDKDFEPALARALEENLVEITVISEQKDDPSFANTIEALATTGHKLGQVLSVFYTLTGAANSKERQELERKFSPRLAQHSADIFSNKALFARIETVWEARDSLNLPSEAARLLQLTRRDFHRAGAGLDGAAGQRMKAIKMRLAELGTSFSQNLLTDEAEWSMPLTNRDVADLPKFVQDAVRAAGAERDLPTACVTLSRSVIVPFLQNCPNRALREAAYSAWTARGANGGQTDNRSNIGEILQLREERAQLLGYDNFAQFKLGTEMAGTPDKVRGLLEAVWAPARTRAEEDARALEEMLRADGYDGRLEAWDWHYYAQRRRQSLHALDEAELKPFFQLDRMVEAAFDCATRLFGLQFNEISVPLYHPDCRAWEVTREGEHVALFIGDYFARPMKSSGAWCHDIQAQRRYPDTQAPIVCNTCNFAKPAEGQAALLSFDDARTLFHEFGHALHQMLSDVTYERMSGTSVARDFVELPSQLYEHWLEVPEVLQRFARHATTDEPIPQELLDRVLASTNYDMGFQTVEYVASARVDLEFHDAPAPADPMQKQAQILDMIGMPHAISMRHASPHFAHVFSGDGYSSGYYSYMWSEVMDADAFAAFEEVGDAFDADTAARLHDHILSKGGTVEAETLYKLFRGRMPSVDALLRGRGLAA